MCKYLPAAGLLFLLFCGVYSVAEDAPKLEIFGGYGFLHIDVGTLPIVNQIPAGFNVDGTYYFNNFLGFTGDFQYNWKKYGDGTPQAICPTICGNVHVYDFMGGPRVKARTGKIEPFAHALFGGTHGSFSPNGASNKSSTAFSTKLGAGLDWVAKPHWAIRIAEANFYYTKFSQNDQFNFNPGTGHQNNLTLSTGIVYRH